jgi:hypothetical protein
MAHEERENRANRPLMPSRASSRIRWRELRLAALSAIAFGVAVALLLPGNWPLMPFPAVAPVEIVTLLGLLFGFVVRRLWVTALPLTVLVAIDPPQSGLAGAVIALLVLWPFAAAGGVLGVGAGKALQRRMLRRTLKAARKRERASKQRRPPVPASV